MKLLSGLTQPDSGGLRLFGVAVRYRFAFAALVKLLQRVSAGRVGQSEPRFGATDIRDDQ